MAEPRGPVWATSRLVRSRSRPGTSTAVDAWMSACVSTVVLGSASGSFCSTRAAVMTTCWSGESGAAWANATWAASSGKAAATARDTLKEEVAGDAATRLFTGAFDPV